MFEIGEDSPKVGLTNKKIINHSYLSNIFGDLKHRFQIPSYIIRTVLRMNLPKDFRKIPKRLLR